jgi:hypothetical protein
MPQDGEPYPRLSDTQIKRCRWIFLSHSHADHAGAWTWLLERGFDGRVVATGETASQLAAKPENLILLDRLVRPLEPRPLADGITASWGRSGHCAGSCWYRLDWCGKVIIYSGDYVEDGLVYECDRIAAQSADLAILDGAYGSSTPTPAEYRQRLASLTEESLGQGRTVLFPVPRNGRGLELMALTRNRLPNAPIYADDPLCGEFRRLRGAADWIKPQSLAAVDPERLGGAPVRRGIIFVSDPQLDLAGSRRMAQAVADQNGAIILTGATYPGSHSRRLLKDGAALFARYPAHMSDADRIRVEGVNSFSVCVPFHCEEHEAPLRVDF